MLIKRIFTQKQQFNYLHTYIQYFYNQKSALFDSQFHRLGSNHFKKSRTIEKILGSNVVKIDTIQSKLNQNRSKIILQLSKDNKNGNLSEEDMNSDKINEYLALYNQLTDVIKGCQINNQWIYNIIGWYNMAPLYTILKNRFIEAEVEELKYLVKAIDLMNHERFSTQVYQENITDQSYRLQKFYKNLSIEIEIKTLRKIQNILKAPFLFRKRKFYQHYMGRNLQLLLRDLRSDDAQSLNDVIWLIQISVQAMNDNEILISKAQKYLLTTQLSLNDVNLQSLMNIYTIKGRINLSIYEKYIKPYIIKTKMKDIGSLALCLEFIICSQCNDKELLKLVIQQITKFHEAGKIKDNRNKQLIHIYTHYLQIQKVPVKLPKNLENQLHHFCQQNARQFQKINPLVLKKHANPKMKKQKHKFSSKCLNHTSTNLTECTPGERNFFVRQYKNKLRSQLDLDAMRIYQNIKFCCFEMRYCLQNQNPQQFVNLQIEGLVFPSGRMIRQKEIRDQILAFYGIKTINLYSNLHVSQSRLSQSQQLMHRRVTSPKRNL